MDVLSYKSMRLTLVTETPLRIGAGVEGNNLVLLTAVMPVRAEVRAGRARVTAFKRLPFIPASSLKGALRALTERIASALYRDVLVNDGCDDPEDLPRCLAALHHQPSPMELRERRTRRCQVTPPVHNVCGTGDAALNAAWRAINGFIEKNGCIEPGERPTESSPLDWGYEHASSRLCPVCILYGSIHQAGALRVTDAVAEESTVTMRTHVSINRASRTRSERMLYAEELVPAGARFSARLHILPPLRRPAEEHGDCGTAYTAALREAARLWSLTLDYVKKFGLVIGSGRSRGQGRLRVIVEEG